MTWQWTFLKDYFGFLGNLCNRFRFWMREETVNLKPIKRWAIEKPWLPKLEKDSPGVKWTTVNLIALKLGWLMQRTPEWEAEGKTPCAHSATDQRYDLEQVTWPLWAALSSFSIKIVIMNLPSLHQQMVGKRVVKWVTKFLFTYQMYSTRLPAYFTWLVI